MSYKLANRVHKVQPSFTLQMATRAAEMRAEGIDVINFSVGEPDFNTPSHIIAAGKKAMDDGFTKYTAGPGMIEFRKAIYPLIYLFPMVKNKVYIMFARQYSIKVMKLLFSVHIGFLFQNLFDYLMLNQS